MPEGICQLRGDGSKASFERLGGQEVTKAHRGQNTQRLSEPGEGGWGLPAEKHKELVEIREIFYTLIVMLVK